MWELLKKYQLYIIAGAIFLAAFVFYSLNLKNKENANAFEKVVLTVSSPLIGVVSSVNVELNRVWNDYIDLVGVRKENRTLRENVKVLNSRLVQNQEALIANERLKKLLALKEAQQYAALTANVIGEDGAPWFKSLLIDRGAVDGLADGMPVIAADGVVGQLVKVSPSSSRVLLLTDHASGIAAIVQRSRARGVIKGKGGGRCTLEFTVREEDVKVGDTIISSGVGRIFPKGIPIGEVAMVKKGEYGIFQTIEVRPFVNLSRLEEVMVLLNPEGKND